MLNVKPLDADTVGLSAHFDSALGEVACIMNEQEMGDREAGTITISLQVKLEPKRDGCTFSVKSSVKAPAKVVSKAGSAFFSNGSLKVIDAEQEELPFDNVSPINHASNEE